MTSRVQSQASVHLVPNHSRTCVDSANQSANRSAFQAATCADSANRSANRSMFQAAKIADHLAQHSSPPFYFTQHLYVHKFYQLVT